MYNPWSVLNGYGGEGTIAVRASVVRRLDAAGAILLSRLLYLQNTTAEPEGWFYGSPEVLERETGLSTSQQLRIRRVLLSLDLVEERRRVHQIGLPGRLEMRFKLDRLVRFLLSDIPNYENNDSEDEKNVIRFSDILKFDEDWKVETKDEREISENNAILENDEPKDCNTDNKLPYLSFSWTRNLNTWASSLSSPPEETEEQPYSFKYLNTKDLSTKDLKDKDLSTKDLNTLTKDLKSFQDLKSFVYGEVANSEEPEKKRKAKSKASPATAELWDAYSSAYTQRYGVPPLRNAVVNSQLRQLISQVGSTVAPALAIFYVQHNDSYYMRTKHPVSLMLKDAQKLHTEWTKKTQPQTQKTAIAWTASRNFPGFELKPGQRDPVTEEEAKVLESSGSMRAVAKQPAITKRRPVSRAPTDGSVPQHEDQDTEA